MRVNEIRGIVKCVVVGGREGGKRTWCRCRNLLLLRVRFFVRNNSVLLPRCALVLMVAVFSRPVVGSRTEARTGPPKMPPASKFCVP
jgi:hypothetical protein